MYWSNNATAGTPLGAYPVATGTATTTFNNQVASFTGHPYYFTISPDEYCTDHTLVQCTKSSVATGSFTFPAPLRYCDNTTDAAAASPVSDPAGSSAPKCRAKFNDVSYRFPRYGRFTRTDIVPSTATYPKSATAQRTDCASASSCTYAEELQNFANWYSYYRTRLAMMKTAAGRAFLPVDDRYRVGFITINPNNPVTSSKYLRQSGGTWQSGPSTRPRNSPGTSSCTSRSRTAPRPCGRRSRASAGTMPASRPASTAACRRIRSSTPASRTSRCSRPTATTTTATRTRSPRATRPATRSATPTTRRTRRRRCSSPAATARWTAPARHSR